ncbi:hypothetical protein GQX74_013507 [Glossina fuscipes]|nr:hypothetical protein GQX74_013507 [Glossina fuscipes]
MPVWESRRSPYAIEISSILFFHNLATLTQSVQDAYPSQRNRIGNLQYICTKNELSKPYVVIELQQSYDHNKVSGANHSDPKLGGNSWSCSFILLIFSRLPILNLIKKQSYVELALNRAPSWDKFYISHPVEVYSRLY